MRLGVDSKIVLEFLEALKSTHLEQCCIEIRDSWTGYIDGLVHLASKKVSCLPNPSPKPYKVTFQFTSQQPWNLLVGYSPGKWSEVALSFVSGAMMFFSIILMLCPIVSCSISSYPQTTFIHAVPVILTFCLPNTLSFRSQLKYPLLFF